MANRIRFTTAQQVVAAFPAVAQDFEDIPADITPLDYLATLTDEGQLPKALIFAGLALPKREAIWWACIALRGMGHTNGEIGHGLKLAEAWVSHPEEEERRAAGDFAEQLYFEGPGAWICFAAFTTSGSLAPAGLQAVPPGPEVSGKSAAFAVAEATRTPEGDVSLENIKRAIECARDFALGGDGTSVWLPQEAASEPATVTT